MSGFSPVSPRRRFFYFSYFHGHGILRLHVDRSLIVDAILNTNTCRSVPISIKYRRQLIILLPKNILLAPFLVFLFSPCPHRTKLARLLCFISVYRLTRRSDAASQNVRKNEKTRTRVQPTSRRNVHVDCTTVTRAFI